MNEEVRHIAKVCIPYEILKDLLHFPEDTKINAALGEIDYIFGKQQVVLVVEHPDLPATYPGEMLRRVDISYRTHYDEEGNVTKVEFAGWQ